MRYFSGFGFCNEAPLFDAWIPQGETVVAGFSYGAQRALEYALETTERIDRLVLLSPAFFHDKNEAFKELQLRHFKKNPEAYKEAFVANVAYPVDVDLEAYMCKMRTEDLHRLLHYRWEEDTLRRVAKRGTRIEVVLGGKDRIIYAQAAFAFFETMPVVTYLIKDAGHLLMAEENDNVRP